MRFTQESSLLSLSYGADESFVTDEDVALYAKPVQTLSESTQTSSKFTLSSQSTHGTISDYDADKGSFKYMPNPGYVGGDSFEYSELSTQQTKAVTRKITITVQPVFQKPWLENKVFNFPMNSANNPVDLVGKDKKDPNPKVLLDVKGFVSEVNTKYGSAKKIAPGKFTYTPQANFRGIDSLEVYVVNNAGQFSQHQVTINVGNPFLNLEPAMAVRGASCVNCHATVSSRFVTDFGFGSAYFFAKPVNPFVDAPISYYGDHDKAWFSATFATEVIVPKASIGLNLAALGNAVNRVGPENAATTVAEYVRAVEAKKSKPATVIEKDSVYIGAPTEALLNARTGGTGGAVTKFIKDNVSTSPELNGIVDRGTYLEASNLVCDGDLIVAKTLYLKNLVLKTTNGCRIYSTRSIFVQGPISYEKLDANANDNTNLQLVSTRWVNLGVGDGHCETAGNPGWYSQNPTTMQMKPSDHRMVAFSAPSRAAPTVNEAKALNAQLLAELRSIPGFQDASCRTSVNGAKPRDVHFERLLINAPRVDSRYTGKYTGVIVSELPLMSLSVFAFSYDPVFNRVPVLPFMKAEDFLLIK